jgi:hypothetical protein
VYVDIEVKGKTLVSFFVWLIGSGSEVDGAFEAFRVTRVFRGGSFCFGRVATTCRALFNQPKGRHNLLQDELAT